VLWWPDFEAEPFLDAVREALTAVRPQLPPGVRVCGNDAHIGAVTLAKAASEKAGVGRDLELSVGDAAEWVLAAKDGGKPRSSQPSSSSASTSSSSSSSASRVCVVSNPPWDMRIQGAEAAWGAMGKFLRSAAGKSTAAKGTASPLVEGTLPTVEAWLLCGNPQASNGLGMKRSASVPLSSGGVDLRFLKYAVLPPRTVAGKEGDWVCPQCGVNNFAGRTECFKCAKKGKDSLGAEEGTREGGRVMQNGAPRTPVPPRDSSLEDMWVSPSLPKASAVQEAHSNTATATSANGVVKEADARTAEEEGVWSAQTVAQLKEALRARGLKVSGLKRDLLERLVLSSAAKELV